MFRRLLYKRSPRVYLGYAVAWLVLTILAITSAAGVGYVLLGAGFTALSAYSAWKGRTPPPAG